MSASYQSQLQAMQDKLSRIIQQNSSFTNSLRCMSETNREIQMLQTEMQNDSLQVPVAFRQEPHNFGITDDQLSDADFGASQPLFFQDGNDEARYFTSKTQVPKPFERYQEHVLSRQRSKSAKAADRFFDSKFEKQQSPKNEMLHLDDVFATIYKVAKDFKQINSLPGQEFKPRQTPSINAQVALRNFVLNCLEQLFHGLKQNIQQTELRMRQSQQGSAVKLCQSDMVKQQLVQSQMSGKQLRKENDQLKEQVRIQDFQIKKLIGRLEVINQQTIEQREILKDKCVQTDISLMSVHQQPEIIVNTEAQLLEQNEAIKILAEAVCRVHAIASNKYNVARPEASRVEYMKTVKASKEALQCALRACQRDGNSGKLEYNIKHLLEQTK